MDSTGNHETREFWDRVAQDWDLQVGDDGDRNRILNSDPVLWHFAGDVSGLVVLDAGCGTGYLSRQLRIRGADVIGVDFSAKMCEIARRKAPDMDFRVDSCSDLATISDDSIDMVIANYVLMDTPDLDRTMRAFHRVLHASGVAIVVFSHPCFPQGSAVNPTNDGGIEYHWDFSYFDQRKCVDPPWAHFTSEFIWFHRPLSDYWKAFRRSGFAVEEFEEPRIAEDRYHLAPEGKLAAYKSRPCSVAFKLRKC
jgi:ubiquinone/menaquinone biosynthesis C-methylase UbiE